MNIFLIVLLGFILPDRSYAEFDQECNTPLTPLLRNDQFSASSEYNTKYNASAARKDDEGWSASQGGMYEYLKVDLESIWEISSLEVQGSSIGWYPRSFRVSVSDDGYVWTGYNTRLSSDVMGELFFRKDSITKIQLDPVIKTRYTVINPVTNYGYAALRVELFGCQSMDSTPDVVTNIQNGIEVNTTWILNQSPVLIHSNIYIRSTVVLTVQAGVKVIFTTKTAGIDVYGTLAAEGIQGLSALFSSNYPLMSERSKWKGISQAAGGRITMKHALIRQAVTGIQGNGSSIKISDSEIHSCSDGIRLSGGYEEIDSKNSILQEVDMILFGVNVHHNGNGVLIHGDNNKPFITFAHSIINQNDGNGILVSNWDNSDSYNILTNLNISNCNVSDNNNNGLQISERIVSNIIIKNSTLTDNRHSGVYFYRRYFSIAKETLNITNSNFVKNKRYGIFVYCMNCKAGELFFHNNTFSDNVEKAIAVNHWPQSVGEISNITISYNSFERNGRRDIETYFENSVRAFILNNNFTRSRTSIKLSGNGLTDTNVCYIIENTFIEQSSNYDESTIEIEGVKAIISNTTFVNSSISTLVKFKDGLDHTFEFNRFINTSSTRCLVSVDQKYDPNYTFALDNNYWGTREIFKIKEKICDFFHDLDKAVANITHIFSTETFETKVSTSDIDDFSINKDDILNATIIGGVLRTHVDLSSLSRVIVNRSLLITETATLIFKNLTVYFASRRGIVVCGNFTIAKEETDSWPSILLAYSTNTWNGIKLYSKDLQIYDMELSGTHRFVDVQGNDSNIMLNNCNASDDGTLQNLIYADMINGNFSVSFRNISVKSKSAVISIRSNDTRNTFIEIRDSYLTSRANIIQLSEATAHKDMRLLSISILNCSMFSSGRSHMFSLSSCSSHLNGTIKGSEMFPHYYQSAAYFKFPSMNVDISENIFGDGNQILYLEFCRQFTETLKIYPKNIYISSNIFNSSKTGTDVLIRKYYTNEDAHKINIMKNIFGYKKFIERQRVYIYGTYYASSDQHSFVVDSNLFANSTAKTINVQNTRDSFRIINNTFVNNSQCVYIQNRLTLNEVDIIENTFLNNTGMKGVIYLDVIQNNITNIIGNNFINNTDTGLAFTSPNTTIKYNFFENSNDAYNLRVLSEDYPDKTVNASLNYWGTNDVKKIAKTIYDKDYVDTLFDIEFRPYLGSKNKTDIQNENIAFISSDREIGGSVNGEITLTLDKSPFSVVSNVDVEKTDVLNIEAGCVFIMKEGVGLKVNGEMNIHGTKENPVLMIPETAGKPWRGIDLRNAKNLSIFYLQMNDTENGLQIQSSNVTIHNVSSNFARQSGISIAVNKLKQKYFKISEVIVENNILDGINIAGLAGNVIQIDINKCTTSDNARYGIHIDSNTTVNLKNCKIEKNTKSGIYLQQSSDGFLNINDSVVMGNKENAISGTLSGGISIISSNINRHIHAYFDRWGDWATRSYINLIESRNSAKDLYINFRNTTFTDNVADGIYISKQYYSRKNISIDIENCTFTGGNRTIVLSDSSAYWVTTRVNMSLVNNVINDNINLPNYLGDGSLIKISVKNYKIYINGNIFRNNTASNGLLMSGSESDTHGDIAILENKFLNNVFLKSTIAIEKELNLHLYRNVFIPFGGFDCIFAAPPLNISYFINATFNYWGTDSAKQVVHSVCGFDKDMDRSFVLYIPFFLDENLVQTISRDPSDLKLSDSFGGEISRDVTISRRTFPSKVRVDRSILVRKGSTLSIEPGIEVQFENNRGIYVQGSLEIFGGNSPVVLENVQETISWYGIVIDSDANGTKTDIYNTRILKTAKGVVLHSSNVEIKKTQIVNSSSHCLTINQYIPIHSYDFEMSKLENCTEYGIRILGNGNTSLKNIAIIMSQFGIGLTAEHGSVEISRVNISEAREEALTITLSDTSRFKNVSINNCLFSSCAKGLKVQTQNRNSNNYIDISGNIFENIQTNTLIIAPYYRYYYYSDKAIDRTFLINRNTFTNSCGVSVETWNNVNMTTMDNVFRNALCSHLESCFLNMLAGGNNMNKYSKQFHIFANSFQNITCKCLVTLDDGGNSDAKGDFVYNQILDIIAKDTVVASNALNINISWNIFDNPYSNFDLYAYKRGNESVNATNNWWGSSDENQVYRRIYDKRRDVFLVSFSVRPVMTDRVIDCNEVNNCSNHGECVSPNRCRCNSGWAGKICMDYDCGGVNYCYGNGDCTAPNTCKCHEGWSGSLCIIASCSLVNNCSGNGICSRPNVCTCAAKFTGRDCSSCVSQHWGQQCEPCPDCQHGKCNLTNGICECENENWDGYLCDKCSETFYGPQCLPLIKVLDIVPNQGLDKGGNPVHVWGHNFPNSSRGYYSCKFGTKQTNGTWIAWNHVVCHAPRMSEGVVSLEISPDGTEFTNDKLMYYFYASCPPGSCGGKDNPPHGQCLFGGCSCFLPWTGGNCDKELLIPEIQKPILDQTHAEGETYFVQLNLTKGSPPVLWSLIRGPSGMAINERSGLLTWKHASAKSSAHTIEARAINLVGQSSVIWNISVQFSYTVVIDELDLLEDILPVPRPVVISGRVVFFNESAARVVPIDILVTSKRTGRKTIIQVLSNPLALDTFKSTYYPRPDDAGVFTVKARHPGSESYVNSNVTWSVLGMLCSPLTVNINEQIISGDRTVTINKISSLYNIGKGVIKGISAKVDGLPDAYARISGETDISQFKLVSLEEDKKIDFDLVIRDARPLSGTIFIKFVTDVGTSTRLNINIKLSIKRPLFTFDPPLFRENILRGTIHVFDIKVNNTGEVSAKDVTVSLPNDSRISLVSFTSSDKGTNTSSNITVPPGRVALISISITTVKTEALGEMSGTIYINSALSSAPFAYTFFITSPYKFSVTFTVKDEYTYFAADAPLVTNAMVKLVNPRRDYSETKFTTNNTGYVTFENVYEDQYSLYAEAEGHLTYAGVILVTSDTINQEIFLQRVAVKYTWSVEPTTVQDVYNIQLESTFETHIPMPVVTIDPAKVNTIAYELEEEDTIEFNITNHGLIRADNVRFNLPTGHPYLNFEMTIDFIGSIEANTSMIVPVKTTLKSRVKRNIGALIICGLLLLYDYDCGGTQTRSLDVTLTREYPGRPPLPCGLGGSGSVGSSESARGGVYYGGRGPGTGRGSSVTYNPTTPLSCDCAKTLIKSCALAFHPVIGCAYAVTDLGTAYKRSNGDLILGTLKFVLGLADTAFACVFGIKYTLWGLMYTSTRCIIDAYLKCGNDRKRREVSSDVVGNMISSAKTIDNFMEMLTEILGDKEMYNFENTLWFQTFKKSVGEDSDFGSLLSKDEVASVLNTLAGEAERKNLSIFLERWNNTAAAWENGTLNELTDTSRIISLSRLTPRMEQYLTDIDSASTKGFATIFDEFSHATNSYKTAEQNEISANGGSQKNDGVCARVRVRIKQELVLTRDAFNAKLEIENGENSDLESIKVEIQIKESFGSGEVSNDKFSIGKPTLIGISGIDGTGLLGKDLSGSAEWLIIPYSNAAPEDDTQYDIGGRLSYNVGGSEFSVPLLPDTITVKPNPSLVVHYFHEKYVQGDNPLTVEKDPVIPFSLAVMVMNNGYGVARALKITSGQPEIIENDKGLLISFKIIGAQIGNSPISPSLAVNFGDILSFETKTARWLLTSTLMGTFYNYSSSFENINPLGDPQLSLLDELGYHELIHLVRIDISSQDDELDDFLVNDKIDNEGIPDRLYNSANGSDVFNVEFANVTNINATVYNLSKKYKIITLSVKTKRSIWFYTRIENNLTNPDPSMKEFLLHANRYDDGKELLVDKNVWQTTHIGNTFYIHLLDFLEDDSPNKSPTDDSTSAVEIDYILIYGPRNMHQPRFNSTAYTVTISKSQTVGSEILTIYAYDIDRDDIDFSFKRNDVEDFDIIQKSKSSCVVAVTGTSLKHGLTVLEVIAKDSGIPPKHTSVKVTITITDANFSNATTSKRVTYFTPTDTTRDRSSLSTTKSTTMPWSSTKPSTTLSSKSTRTLSSPLSVSNSTSSNVSNVSEPTSPSGIQNTTRTSASGITSSTTGGSYRETTVSSSFKASADEYLVLVILLSYLF